MACPPPPRNNPRAAHCSRPSSSLGEWQLSASIAPPPVAVNALVGKIGGLYATMPAPAFWLMHAGFAAVCGAIFLLFKLVLGRRLVGAPSPAVATG